MSLARKIAFLTQSRDLNLGCKQGRRRFIENADGHTRVC